MWKFIGRFKTFKENHPLACLLGKLGFATFYVAVCIKYVQAIHKDRPKDKA